MSDYASQIANGLINRWGQWEAEAGQLAQQEQCPDAGAAHMNECVASYIRMMYANHSVSRCSVCHWPLVVDPKDGCTPGNCSQRPKP